MNERVQERIKPGGIIFLHDGLLDRTRNVQALSVLLEGLREKGFRTTTVGNLLGKSKFSNTALNKCEDFYVKS